MIISKTPFRVSLFGGSTDYESFFVKEDAFLVGFAMDKYCYTTLRFTPKLFNWRTRLSYSKVEEVANNSQIEHNGVRGVLEYFGLKSGVEISHMSDLPSQTGIGSSSSFIVGLVNAMSTLLYENEERMSPFDLADSAIYIERKLLKEAGGIQDQIYAAYGGLISIKIDGFGKFSVRPIPVSSSFTSEFLSRSTLVYTGKSRDSFDIAKSHNSSFEQKMKIKELSLKGYQAFCDESIEGIAEALRQSWSEKKRISNRVSTPAIDALYSDLESRGMIGGKLLGAGGDGFIFCIAKNATALKRIKSKFDCIDVNISNKGSEIING